MVRTCQRRKYRRTWAKVTSRQCCASKTHCNPATTSVAARTEPCVFDTRSNTRTAPYFGLSIIRTRFWFEKTAVCWLVSCVWLTTWSDTECGCERNSRRWRRPLSCNFQFHTLLLWAKRNLQRSRRIVLHAIVSRRRARRSCRVILSQIRRVKASRLLVRNGATVALLVATWRNCPRWPPNRPCLSLIGRNRRTPSVTATRRSNQKGEIISFRN